MGYEVDFLAVGEGEKSGDAIALRFGNLYGKRNEQTVIVIDGGYQESGERLVEHIKYYYKTTKVDLVVATHPDGDHASGLSVVLEKLDVETLWMHQPWKHTNDIAKLFIDGRVTDNSVRKSLRESLEAIGKLEKIAKSKRIPIIEPFVGLKDKSGCFSVLGPTINFYESQLPHFRSTPDPREHPLLADRLFLDEPYSKVFGVQELCFFQKWMLPDPREDSARILQIPANNRNFVKIVAESWDYETLSNDGETSAENDSSTILLLTFENQRLLFTADAGIPALTEVVDRLENKNFDFSTLNFVQIPHHGSRRNVRPSLLNRLIGYPILGYPKKSRIASVPKMAFVSAAMKGAPKHPSKQVTNAFQRRGYEVHTTQGTDKCYRYDAPVRASWIISTPVEFYTKVED